MDAQYVDRRTFNPIGLVVRVRAPQMYRAVDGRIMLDLPILQLAPYVEQLTMAQYMTARHLYIQEIPPPHGVNAHIDFPRNFTNETGDMHHRMVGTFNYYNATGLSDEDRERPPPMTHYFNPRLIWNGAWAVMLLEVNEERPMNNLVNPSVTIHTPAEDLIGNGTVVRAGARVVANLDIFPAPNNVAGYEDAVETVVRVEVTENPATRRLTIIPYTRPTTTREYLVAYFPVQTRGYTYVRDVTILNANMLPMTVEQFTPTPYRFVVTDANRVEHYVRYRGQAGDIITIPMVHGVWVERTRELTLPAITPNLQPVGQLALLTDLLSVHATPDLARAVEYNSGQNLLTGAEMERLMARHAANTERAMEPYQVMYRYYGRLHFIMGHQVLVGLMTQEQMDARWGVVMQFINARVVGAANRDAIEEIRLLQGKIQSLHTLAGELDVEHRTTLLNKLRQQLNALMPHAALEQQVDQLEVEMITWSIHNLVKEIKEFLKKYSGIGPGGNVRGPPIDNRRNPPPTVNLATRNVPLYTQVTSSEMNGFENVQGVEASNIRARRLSDHGTVVTTDEARFPYLMFDDSELESPEPTFHNPGLWCVEKSGRLLAELSNTNLRELYLETWERDLFNHEPNVQAGAPGEPTMNTGVAAAGGGGASGRGGGVTVTG